MSPLYLPQFGAPVISGCNPKFKTGSRLMLCLSRGFQNVMSQPHGTNTHKEDRILGNGLLPTLCPGSVPHGAGHQTQCYYFCLVLAVKIYPRFKHPVKSYSISAERQTDRHTHILHPHMQGQDFFCIEMFFFSLHFVHYFPHSFTLFVKDNRSVVNNSNYPG